MKAKFPPERVIVAVDGSAPSWAAFDAARSLAARFDCDLEAVHVEEPVAAGPFEPQPGRERALRRALRGELERRLSAAAADLRPGTLSFKTLTGEPAAELVRRAGRRAAQILVVGTHAREGAERFLLGSIAETAFHRSAVPVLAVREQARFAPARVLMPCNMEPYADDALLYGLELARAFGARATAFYVSDGLRDLEAARRAFAGHLVRVFGPAAATMGRVVRRGAPREVIADEANGGEYDLVLLSAHHRDQLSDFALGSTAERLLRRVKLPVLVAPSAGVDAAALKLSY